MWDNMVQNDVMCNDAKYVEGAGGLPMPTGGGPGVLPCEFFVKNKHREGHFRAILKTLGKKG